MLTLAEEYVHVEGIVDKRAGPGILMLTASLQMVYRDRRAWDLSGRINALQNSTGGNSVLAPPIAELCADVIAALKVRTNPKDWEQFQIRRVIGDPRRPILLTGLGIPDPNGIQHSRILIIFSELGRRQEAAIEQAQDAFHLTGRELAVVKNLLKGWTNKEIAHDLAVSEQTVKEHIKHIMAKTKTTTRTGILVQVMQL